MNSMEIRKLIERHMKEKSSIDTEQIEDFTIMHTFNFPKNSGHALEKYPIVDKGIGLVEIEYYANRTGYRRIYAIENETNRFMDINQDTLELILKTNIRISEIEEDIRHLYFFKSDNKNILCKKVLIKKDNKKETVEQLNMNKECDYVLPSIRRVETYIEKMMEKE